MLGVFEALDLRKARGKICKSDKRRKDLLVRESMPPLENHISPVL
jgi:hypothetical protein